MIPGIFSADEEKVARMVADKPMTGKAIAGQLGIRDRDGQPCGSLKYALSTLRKRGVINNGEDGYTLTDTGRTLLAGNTETNHMGTLPSASGAAPLPELVRLLSSLARPTRLQLDVDGWNITLVVKPVGERDREPPDGHRHKPLSDVGESIVQAIGTGSKTGKELASALDMAAEDKSPTPELRVRIKDLKERGLIDYDGKGYRLTPAALTILELSK